MSNISVPEISHTFGVEDIHKIREWHYEKRKGMTPQEISEDTRKGAERFLSLLSSPIDPSIQTEVCRRLQSVCKKPLSASDNGKGMQLGGVFGLDGKVHDP